MPKLKSSYILGLSGVFSALFLAFVFLALPLSSSALTGRQGAPEIRIGDLQKTPLDAGMLKITFTRLTGTKFLQFSGSVEMVVENENNSFDSFSPPRLLFVDRNGKQVNLLGTLFRGREPVPAADTDIAPHARLKLRYRLTDKMELPVKIYYDKSLLATVVK